MAIMTAKQLADAIITLRQDLIADPDETAGRIDSLCDFAVQLAEKVQRHLGVTRASSPDIIWPPGLSLAYECTDCGVAVDIREAEAL